MIAVSCLRRTWTAFTCLLIALTPVVASGTDAAADTDGGQGEIEPAPRAAVMLDGHTILLVRGVAGYTAEERAAAIESRLVAFAADRGAPAQSVQIVETPLGTALQAGSVRLLAVTDADASIEGLPRALLASVTREALVQAVDAWREARTPARLLNGAAWFAAATILLVAVLWLLRRALRWLLARVVDRVSARGVRIRAIELLEPARVRELVLAALRTLYWGVALVSLYVYLQFALSQFPWTRTQGERLLGFVVDPLSTFGLAFVAALPELFFLLVLAIIVRYLLKVVRAFFAAIERGTVQLESFDADWAMPTYKVLRIFILAFAVVVAYPYIPGSESAAFKGVSVLLGVLLSLGSSSVVSNVISGYTMTYRRAFRVGDVIRVGDTLGAVVEARLLETSVRTPKNELVVVPNSEILGRSLVNYSRLAGERGLILHTTVGIGYETPWRQVEAMLLIAADRTEGLSKDPAPFVLTTALGDFCVTYEINAFTRDPGMMARLYSRLHLNILDVFNEYGVQIMTPAYERDPEVPKVVPPERWHDAPAAPRATDND